MSAQYLYERIEACTVGRKNPSSGKRSSTLEANSIMNVIYDEPFYVVMVNIFLELMHMLKQTRTAIAPDALSEISLLMNRRVSKKQKVSLEAHLKVENPDQPSRYPENTW